MYDRLQQRALKTRLKIPILFGVDAVHGHSNVVGATIFPHNVGLGATRNAKLVEEVHRLTAKEVRATGIQWTFAPCVTVPQDIRWGRTYEGFSEDPALVAELGEAAVRGLQGTSLADPLRVLACAKHWIGDGGTVWGTGKPDGRTAAPSARPGRRDAVRSRPAEAARPGLRHGPQGRRRHDHAVLQLVERREGVRQRAAADRPPEEADGLRGLPDLRLQRHRRHPRRLPQRHQDVGQRRHGHDDGAVEVQGVLHDAQEPGRGEGSADGAHRRRRAPHPAREVRDGADGSEAQPARGSVAAGQRRLRPSTAPWRGRPCASRWCC